MRIENNRVRLDTSDEWASVASVRKIIKIANNED